MVKGCQKKLIVLKNVDSDFVEEVHFIMRDGTIKSPGRSDMVKEANRIISENICGKRPAVSERKRHTRLKWFIAGAISCAIPFAVFFFLK